MTVFYLFIYLSNLKVIIVRPLQNRQQKQDERKCSQKDIIINLWKKFRQLKIIIHSSTQQK